jgi:hypothetical protein
MIPITYSNILAVFFNATDLERLNGQQWYLVANQAAAVLANRYQVPLIAAAGVIAALSPNNRWDRNLIDADSLTRAYFVGGLELANTIKVATYNNNKTKALSILNGAEPLDILGGLKVRAFYGCIIGQDDVCIDGHAYAIWQGYYIPTTKTPKITPKVYSLIVDDYELATDKINLILSADYTSAQVQAFTWLAWRRMIKEGSK